MGCFPSSIGTQPLNRTLQVETKVYVKPTNTGLLLHYHGHVYNHYKRSFIYLTINEWGWVGYEELSRSKRVLSAEAEGRGG